VDGDDDARDGVGILATHTRRACAVFFLALYAFEICGYGTATLATFCVGHDAENEEAE
jgi:hypothetical protein